MLLMITFVKTCTFDVKNKQDSEKKSKIIANKFVYAIKTVWDDGIKRGFNYCLNKNCRKQMKFNLRDQWIMHLHHIGLPPATNHHFKLSVSGNSFIGIKLI